MLGNFVGGQRLFDVGFHQQHGLSQLGVTRAQAVLQRNTLALATLADALYHQLFRHRPGQLRPVIPRQHRQQQVGHRHTAAGGQSVAIPVEQVAGGNHLGEAFGKVILPAPVHGCPVPIEQAQHCQRIHPGRQATDQATTARQLLERR
ncbi:hypothetical protein D3C80_1383270 [compost metagenome]